MRDPAVRLFALVLALAAAAGALVAADAPPPAGRAGAFHRLVGGLGFGPAADPSGCAFGFDPRVCPACEHDAGPVPGGAAFCPHHGGAVFEYPPLPGESDAGLR
jgi:hypothetical protein